MPIEPKLRARVNEAIGATLPGNEEIKNLVEEATGEDPYNIYTNPQLPRAQQISEILGHLEQEGTERWLLTYVLVRALQDERIRKLIVEACPSTLRSLPEIDNQVDRVLQNLQQLLRIPFAPELRHELRPKRSEIETISQYIVILYAYKSLHEHLHGLQLKMTLGTLVDPALGEEAISNLKTIRDHIDKLCSEAPATAALIGAGSEEEKIELVWVAELKRLNAQIQAAVDARNIAAGSIALDEVQRVIRQHLARLNGRILDAARQLSIEKLIGACPIELEIRLQEVFDQFKHSIRDLKPTVLARALKHKIWQDTENEFSLVDELFDVPSRGAMQFGDHWIMLKARVRWLATLDPDAEWAARARQYSDDIDDQLAEEKLDSDVRPLFETYRNLIRICFFGIDAMLKSDCRSLRKIEDPLKSILQEIGHG